MPEIPISVISENPFNSRIRYAESDIRLLADSIQQMGLLSPILVRPREEEMVRSYELVFGHRRLRAAKLLGWETIKADIRELSNIQMVKLSLSENLVRSDLSDYEKALSFARMNHEFGMSQEEIGKLAGLSRTHVCNYIRMLDLVETSFLEREKQLQERLHLVSEHHAREILRLREPEDRIKAINLVATQGLSVQDLHRVVHRFRGWFDTKQNQESIDDDEEEAYFAEVGDQMMDARGKQKDIQEIKKILEAECELPQRGDFHAFAKLHDIENGFSIYSSFSPDSRQEGTEAMTTIKNWFYNEAPKLKIRIRDLHVRFYGNLALSTFYADFAGAGKDTRRTKSSRGTMVLVQRSNGWKIVHEHWSRALARREKKETLNGEIRNRKIVLPGQLSF